MADYDCEYCEYRNECNRFEYDCPFVTVKTYKEKYRNILNKKIKEIATKIDDLDNLDYKWVFADEIYTLRDIIGDLKDKINKPLSLIEEWKEIENKHSKTTDDLDKTDEYLSEFDM